MFGTNINQLGKKEKNAKVKEGPCIIPFKYKWKTHDECFPTEKGPICATSVSERNTLQTYGYCKKLNTTKSPTKSPSKTRKIKKLKPIKIKKAKLITMKKPVYNEQMINATKQIYDYLMKKGEPFRARAYKKAYETLMMFPDDITSVEQVKGKPGIGEAIYKRLGELVKTGKIEALERYKKDPMFLFSDIYGIGPKKAKELVTKNNITSIEQLRENQDLLNDKQKVGLKYYEDILQRIPRDEIVEFEKVIMKVFEKIKFPGSTFEIVGSYRRGAKDSGDIDVIISDSDDKKEIFKLFLDELEKEGIIVYFLSRGKTKSLVVGKIPGKKYARRLDFLYSTPKEYPFSVLYFTGSALFNTLMRNQALKLGYTMNEHTIANKSSKEPVEHEFKNERDIFDFLRIQYVEPHERNSSKHFKILAKEPTPEAKAEPTAEDKPKKKTIIKKANKTIKKRSTAKKDITAFISQGISYLNTLDEKALGQMLVKANDAYYNKEPLMSDAQFDIVKEYVEEKYPESDYLKQIGAPIQQGKVKLPFFMGSMDKIKPDTKVLSKWLGTYKGPYVLSAKLDGISGLFVNKKGEEPKLYTRGDGTEGQDISHFIPYLKLPMDTKDIVLRGELIMKKDTFEKKYAGTYKNARNMVAGKANKKTVDPEIARDIDFVMYEVIEPVKKTPKEQFDLMDSLEPMIVAKHQYEEKVDNNNLSEILSDWRDNYEYEIDGIIVTNDKVYERTDGNPKHSVAFKMVMSDQVMESNVVDVLWQASKHGYLKPRIRITPISIKGVTIEYATAFNAAFIRDNKIGVGAVVQMVRSGDVIPYIQKVLVPADEPLMPNEEYVWNDTNVDIMLKEMKGNRTVEIKKLVAFFKGIEVEGLSEGNLTKIYDAGFTTLGKILSMKIEDFMTVPSFKIKKSTKVHDSIVERMKLLDLPTLAALSQSFGRGFGVKRMESLLQEYPDVFKDDATKKEKLERIKKIEGFSTKIGQNVVDNIDDFKEFLIEIDMMHLLDTYKVVTPKIKDHELNGKTIVMTGFRSKELQERIKDVGGKMGSSVSKKTFALLVPSLDEDTGKVLKAKSLGIPIFTKEMFTEKYKL